MSLAAAALTLALVSCGSESRPGPPDPENVVRIEPLPVGPEDDAEPSFDPNARARALSRRFPGVRAIDFVRVLLVPEERSGACWTEVARPWETRVDLRATIDGETEAVSGIAALKKAGWWPLYRSPEGFGFERRARFESLDFEVESGFVCRCVDRPVPPKEKRPSLAVRFRWEEGGMPEVSGAVRRAGRRDVLEPKAVYGHLLTWQFPARVEFDDRQRRERCGLRVTVSILNDPPIL